MGLFLAAAVLASLNSNVAAPARVPGHTPDPLVAQVATSVPFPDIPDNHWAYETLDSCRKLGMIARWEEPLRGNRTPTRSEISNAIVEVALCYNSLCAQLMPGGRKDPNIPPDAPTGGPERERPIERALAIYPRLENLVEEFGDDMPAFVRPDLLLRYLHADRNALLAPPGPDPVKSFSFAEVPGTRRQPLPLTKPSFTPPVEGSQDYFPDVPDNHWDYGALARCRKADLAYLWTDRLIRGNRGATEGDLADASIEVVLSFCSVAKGLKFDSAAARLKPETPTDRQERFARIQELRELEPMFEKVLLELGPHMPIFVDPVQLSAYFGGGEMDLSDAAMQAN